MPCNTQQFKKKRLQEEKDCSVSDTVQHCDIYYGNKMITSETAYCKLLIGVPSVHLITYHMITK